MLEIIAKEMVVRGPPYDVSEGFDADCSATFARFNGLPRGQVPTSTFRAINRHRALMGLAELSIPDT